MVCPLLIRYHPELVMETHENPSRILFLDFDGVICNSINECFVSSWIGHHGVESHPDRVPLLTYSRFVAYRPFIRRGGDYLILQYCIEREIELTDQSDFDAVEAELGGRTSDEFHARFYEAREYLLETRPDYWLRLNPLYEQVRTHLAALAQKHWIITTKKAEFAAKILRFHDIRWPVERIICSGKEHKIGIIGSILDEGDAGQAVLLDDQLDHFLSDQDSRVTGVLAAWGYVKREWLDTREVEVLAYDEVTRFLGEFS